MVSNDHILARRVRQTRGLMRELVDLADEQNWTYRVKDEGLLFSPPKERARPGFERVFASDPAGDSHAASSIRERFRKAGLKFPEDEIKHRKVNMTLTSKTNGLSHGGEKPLSDFASARQKMDAIMALVSELDDILKQIQTKQDSLEKLRELLKGISA